MSTREARMVPREERWRSGYEDAYPGSQDAHPGRKMEARDAKKSIRMARYASGKLKIGPDAKNGRGEAKAQAID
jgi:hypothetical protein